MLLPLNSLDKAGVYAVDSMAHYNHQSFLGELESHQVLAVLWYLTVLQGQEPGNSGPNRHLMTHLLLQRDLATSPMRTFHLGWFFSCIAGIAE